MYGGGGEKLDMALARRLARVAEARAGAREAALSALVQSALAEVHLTPEGAVDWRQTECTDASRAVDALANGWRALADQSPAAVAWAQAWAELADAVEELLRRAGPDFTDGPWIVKTYLIDRLESALQRVRGEGSA